jgi:ATP-dependent helicase/nuclease subunit B
VRLVCCDDPVAEARFAAREIWRFVRGGGRFRDVLVLVRDLELVHDTLRRVFGEYEIPCHWDRREPVAHHPLVVLTRGAFRLVARDWRQADWLAVLKSGLVGGLEEEELDALENEALARGWEGRATWLGREVRDWWVARGGEAAGRWDRVLKPWRAWAEAVGCGAGVVSGRTLVTALQRLWRELGVEERLELWAAAGTDGVGAGFPGGAVHRTVWEQLQVWLEDVDLAFGGESLAWADWLPVLEAGLADLTVGVVPPALDQVLVGTVDRSWQSEARLVLLLGWNEGVFPARPAGGPLLSEEEWQRLEAAGLGMDLSVLERRAREEHFAYLACTRAREQLVITWCRRDGRGRVMNPSSFVGRVRSWFPGLAVEVWSGDVGEGWAGGEVVHWREGWARALRWCAGEGAGFERAEGVPELFGPLVETFAGHGRSLAGRVLSPGVVDRLYGRRLRLSATQLERFGACPFQFFVWGGLLARERQVYEVDAADRGSFLHQVLAAFHGAVEARGKCWRDLEVEEARALLREVGEAVAGEYRNGLFASRAVRRCMVVRWLRELESFLEVVLGWMREGRYRLDPVLAEREFGGGDGGRAGLDGPGVVLEAGEGRQLVLTGRLDRVDALRVSEGEAVAVVMDYKSGRARLDRAKVAAGLDWQLRVYLQVLEDFGELRERLGVDRVRPVGAFYVPLRPGPESGGDAGGSEEEQAAQRRRAYQHQGLFDFGALGWLEATGDRRGEQFAWRRTGDGLLHAQSWQAMDSAAFARFREESRRMLLEVAARIWRGEVGPDPYRHQGEVACDFCACGAICRLDRRRHRFRRLAVARPGFDRGG